MKLQGKESAAAKKRILIVDDHPIVREGLGLLINREKDLEVCGEASGASDTLQAVEKSRPDLILMDISIRGANGIELTKNLRARCPSLPVLMLSMHDETLYAERALRAGAKGYLMKQEAPEVVLKAIRRVLDGDIFVSERVSSRILFGIGAGGRGSTGRVGIDSLTDRELEIFELIGQGISAHDIATRLGLSIKTVECHRSHLRSKLRLRNAGELNHHAIRWIESDAGNRTA